MSKITAIKDYIESVFPSSKGVYTYSDNKGLVQFDDDGILSINFYYEGIDEFPKTMKKDLIKNLDKIMGFENNGNRVVPYTDGKTVRVVINYRYTIQDDLEDKVQSKGFRTLLGLKK